MKVWAEPFPRSSTPPKSAEVIGWPFPQFAQKQKKDWDPLNKDYDIDEKFERS
jgi:hypothetical protein